MADFFIPIVNIERYRALLANERNERRRALLEKLIAETEAELRDMESSVSEKSG